jgi:hypothetical protein
MSMWSVLLRNLSLEIRSFDLESNYLPSGKSFLISRHRLVQCKSFSVSSSLLKQEEYMDHRQYIFMHKSTVTFPSVYPGVRRPICFFSFCRGVWKTCNVRYYPPFGTIRNSPILYIHMPVKIRNWALLICSPWMWKGRFWKFVRLSACPSLCMGRWMCASVAPKQMDSYPQVNSLAFTERSHQR